MKLKHQLLSAAILTAAVLTGCTGMQDDTTIISNIDDLKNKTVAVIRGSVQDLLASETCIEGTILRVESEADLYALIATGKACAGINTNLSWKMAEKQFPDIVPMDAGVKPQPIGFAFKKGSDDLQKRFNAFLKDYIQNNDIGRITSEWADPDSPRRMPSPDDLTNPSGTIRFVVATIAPPFDFIKNGEISGVESEILTAFAIHENMRWEFMNVSFSSIIPCLQSDKADIGGSIMCITPERQQSVDFSEAWTEESSILLVNKKFAPAEAISETVSNQTSFIQGIKDSLIKSLVTEDRYLLLLEGLEATFLIAILAAIFGTLLGVILCWASMHHNKMLAKTANLFIGFIQCMPQVVFLMIMFYIVFGRSDIDGSWVAIIAFSLCFGAYTSVIFRTSVQSIDKGQTEAALSMGFGKLKAFWNIILPQTIVRALPVYEGEFIGLVKATSIVGYIAVFDLTQAGDIIRSRTYEAFFPLILVTILYFLVIWALTAVLKFIETKSQPTRKVFFK